MGTRFLNYVYHDKFRNDIILHLWFLSYARRKFVQGLRPVPTQTGSCLQTCYFGLGKSRDFTIYVLKTAELESCAIVLAYFKA